MGTDEVGGSVGFDGLDEGGFVGLLLVAPAALFVVVLVAVLSDPVGVDCVSLASGVGSSGSLVAVSGSVFFTSLTPLPSSGGSVVISTFPQAARENKTHIIIAIKNNLFSI